MPDLGQKLYSFAVISDTHVNAREDSCNSPFPVNAKANARFRHVVADLNQRDIAFVVHMGDLLHPVPESGPLYAQAAQAYRDIVTDLSVPIHILPGNHDIGDTPVKGAPASPVTQPMIDAWTSEFGPQYHSFVQGGIRVVCLNAQLINSGLPDESKQAAWAQDVLQDASERVFLMLHHPPYICSPDEPNHYDNTDAPGRDWVLDLAETYNIEAMFAGHAHNFWYDRYAQTDYYLCAATSFVRQDYAEMQRAAPPAQSEFGRDDRAKLGYFIVHIYEGGHTVQFVRTNGAELATGGNADAAQPLTPTPRENTNPLIGFDLRQNWAEITEVAPSGGLDEFDRKIARNDYPLLALIEMGVRNIRIPVSDLRDPVRFKRLGKLRHLGFLPTLFSFGVPPKSDMELISAACPNLADWEITVDWDDFQQDLPKIAQAHRRSGLPIYISRMRTKADLAAEGVYFHVINQGFTEHDQSQLHALKSAQSAGVIGAVFRLGHTNPVQQIIHNISQIVEGAGLKASIHLRMGHDNPAIELPDEKTTLRRVRESLKTVQKVRGVRVFCDTLSDCDRGYFPKTGAIDRIGNPNTLMGEIQAAHLLKPGH